jgi:hypothetical protein
MDRTKYETTANRLLHMGWRRWFWTLLLGCSLVVGIVTTINNHVHPTVGNSDYTPRVGDCVSRVASGDGPDLRPATCGPGTRKVISVYRHQDHDVSIRSLCAPDGATSGWVQREEKTLSSSAYVVCLARQPSTTTTAEAPTTSPAADATPPPSERDLRLLGHLRRDIRRWNRLSGVLVNAYAKSSGDVFVTEERALRPARLRLSKDMTLSVNAFEGPMGRYFSPVVEVYTEKLIDLGVLSMAVERHNSGAESAALKAVLRDGRVQVRRLGLAMRQIRARYGNEFPDLLLGITK